MRGRFQSAAVFDIDDIHPHAYLTYSNFRTAPLPLALVVNTTIVCKGLK